MFFLKKRISEDRYIKLKDGIEKDLSLSLNSKGITAHKIDIDVKQKNVNIRVCVAPKK